MVSTADSRAERQCGKVIGDLFSEALSYLIKQSKSAEISNHYGFAIVESSLLIPHRGFILVFSSHWSFHSGFGVAVLYIREGQMVVQ